MRTLTRRELNRALLARQLLLERPDAPLPDALERVGGIQAQYAPSMYFGLWSRLADFERDALTRALEAREVVQGTLMRVTIHLVSPRRLLAVRASRCARRGARCGCAPGRSPAPTRWPRAAAHAPARARRRPAAAQARSRR